MTPTSDTPDTASPGEAQAATAAPQKHKRRRWPWILLGVIVVLGLLVALAPTLLSTGPGRSLIVSIANSQLRGRVEIDELSLGWTSPTEVRGLRLYDPQGRLVAETADITTELSAWGAIAHPETFGQLAVRSANLTLYETPDGGFSIANALPEPSPPREPRERKEPSAEPSGRILLEDASIELVRINGRRLKVSHIQTTLDLQSSAKMSGRTSFSIDSGGHLEMSYDLDNLSAPDPMDYRVQASIATPQRIELAPIILFATGRQRVLGQLTIDGDISHVQPNGKADLAIRVHQLRAPDPQGQPHQPLDIAFDIDAARKGNEVGGDINLQTVAGKAALTFKLIDPAAWRGISSEEFTAAVLDGEPIRLPFASVHGTSDIDLPRIMAALPGLPALPGKATLTGGHLTSSFHLASGDAVAADATTTAQPLVTTGTFNLTDVSLLRKDPPPNQPATITWPPTTAKLNAAIVPNKGLTFSNTNVNSGFAEAAVTGTAANLDARANVNLAAAWQQLQTIVDLGEKQLAGSVQLVAKVDRPEPGNIAANVNVAATNVDYRRNAKDDQPVHLDAAQLTLPMTITRIRTEESNRRKLQRVAWNDAAIVVNNRSTIRTAGNYNADDERLKAMLDIDRQDLGPLTSLARTFGADLPANVAGLLTLNVDATVPTGETGTVEATYSLGVANLDVQQPQQRISMAAFNLMDGTASYDRQTERLNASVGIDGKALKVITQSKATEATAADSRTIDVPSLGGKFAIQAGQPATTQTVEADLTASNLQIVTGQKTVPFGTAKVDLAATMDTAEKLIRIETLAMTSPPLNVQLTGENTIADYDTDRQLNLQGDFRGQWRNIMELLYAVKPALNDEEEIVVSFSGSVAPGGADERGSFTVTGPARQPNVQPVFRGVDGKTAFGWSSGSVAGIELGPAAIRPVMQAGKLVIQAEPISASGGTLRPGGTIDFTAGDPLYTLPGETKLMENVALKPAVGTQLLSRINPVFGKLVGLEGKMSLTVRELSLPLGEAIKTRGSGSGHLDLSNMKVKSRSGLLDALIGMWGKATGEFSDVRVEGVDFVIKDGRIHYDNFRMIFGEDFDLLFHGSVGFDETLDLWVSVPVHAGVLKAFKIKESVLDVTRVLQQSGVRIEIPIQGTRLSPTLRFDRQRIDKLIKEAMKKLAQQGVQDALKRLLQDSLKPPANGQ